MFVILKYYVNEFKTTFKDWLIDRIRRTIERCRFWIEEHWSYLSDMAPVGRAILIYQGQLEGYVWLTISLISSNICFRIGQLILPLLFDDWETSVYGFIVSGIIGYYIDLREINEDFRKVIALVSCAVDGLVAGGIYPETTLTFFMPPGIVLTLNVCFASLFYNRLFARCWRPIFVAATLSPGVAVCLAYVFTIEDAWECFKVTLLIATAIMDYQMNLGRLIEGSILTPSDRTFSYSLYSRSCQLFTSIRVVSVLKDSGSVALTRKASQTSLNALSDAVKLANV